MSEEISREEIAALLARGSEEMTREETKVKTFDVLRFIADNAGLSIFEAIEKAYNMGLSEQEPKTEQFAKWVATEIFDDMWEYKKDAFAEIACRKLEKLGIVRAKGDEWELVEPQESEG